ncbi:MAG: ABC transporter permease subunit [Planctomycetota bacterium]|jgi:ABC-type transport system involved in multi-copper enzyme maturation permease subunit
MPIYDKGYRRWEGTLRGRAFRWFVIARAGIRLTSRGHWVRRFALIAWLPMLYYGFAFFVVGQMTDVENVEKARAMPLFGMFRDMFGGPVAEQFIEDPASFRSLIWSLLIHFFMHYTQIFCVMIMVAIVGPKLVSEDIKTRALSLYFSKPLTRVDYIAGKLAVIAFWVGMVTLVPSLTLYGVSILFSPSLETLVQTIHIVPKILGYSLLLMVGCGMIMLALSSCTRNARFLGFIWAGFWVMSYIASKILSYTLIPTRTSYGGPAFKEGDWTSLLAFHSNFDAIGVRLFNIVNLLEPLAEISLTSRRLLNQLAYGHDWRWSLAIVVFLTLFSAVVAYLRIGRPGEGGTT